MEAKVADGKFRLFDFSKEEIRVLHYTWIAFFLTFYVWFNFAPLASTMLKSLGFLKPEHIKALLICNVALTIPGRVVIGAMIDKFGPKRVFAILMILMAIPGLFFAFGNTFTQLLVSRLLLSVIGAGFVIGIRMTGQWFPPKHIGRAEGFYAGWGNFGSAAAAGLVPFIAFTVFGGEDGWRWSLASSSILCAIYGVIYFFIARDLPKEGATKDYHFVAAKKMGPMPVSNYTDLVQYILWSFPLYGALGVLAWRLEGINIDGHPVISSTIVNSIYVILGLWYLFTVFNILKENLPALKKGVPDEEKYHWGSVAALNSTYFANFGAELAVVSMLPWFFQTVFSTLKNAAGEQIMTVTMAGLVAGSFAFINLVARPLGGYLSDRMSNRKRTMLLYMVGIALGFFLMGLIPKYGPIVEGVQTLLPQFEGIWWLVTSVVITMFCSMFVQGAEGATFAFVPLINHKIQGKIAGMAGAYGNVGAVIYLVIYSLVDAKTFFYIVAAGAAISFLFCWYMLKEPKNSFAEE
ncbi:MAG: MFS transporter [Flavobacteriales bacterium CG_4_10_14_0_2_um_filter_32_8]|nr:MAG: MFS transporter [Flavobacteriales bacterium CG_4_10_14_0_2_um_filter_32_8]PJB14198.1 MAG: MFS transporter [Flavobacteriales bacterium CG_4_9_14_3_um_filter_32_8]